jgi:hypothetical protein
MLMLHWHNPDLTTGSRFLFESLIFAQLMKKPVAFYCIWGLVLIIRYCASFLYWARGVQSISSHPVYLNCFNIGLPQENCHVGTQSAELLSCLDCYGTTVWCSKCQTLPVFESQFSSSSSIFFFLLLFLFLLLLLWLHYPQQDKHFPGCSSTTISILCCLSPSNNSHLFYVILYLIFPSSLGSTLRSFVIATYSLS